MPIINKSVNINIKNIRKHIKKYYKDKGYDISLSNITVKIEDLWPQSHTILQGKCDYCDDDITITYKDYYKRVINGSIHKCACQKCQLIKRKESNLTKYGTEEFLSLPNVRKQINKTNNKKYCGNSPMHSVDVRQKQQQILIDKYGAANPSQIEEFQIKKAQTKFKNNTCNISAEQKRLSQLFNGILNYPIGIYNVDILIDNILILEYDGDGHNISVKYHLQNEEDFNAKEKQRTEYLLEHGYYIIRFINKKWWITISDNDYISAMNQCQQYLKDHNCKVVSYNFNNNTIFESNY